MISSANPKFGGSDYFLDAVSGDSINGQYQEGIKRTPLG